MIHISGFTDEAAAGLDDQLALASSLGMKYICPRVVDGKNIAKYTPEEFEKALLPKLRQASIGFSSIGSPIGKIRWNSASGFEKQKEQLRNLIAIAEMTGCKYIRIFSFFVSKSFDDRKVYPVVLKKTRELLALAEGHDVTLLHENEKGIYGAVPERALKLYTDVAHPQFKLCFDASNYLQCGCDPYAAYERTREHTVYYHMKDCENGYEVPLGTGQGRIRDILTDLTARGYDGFLTMEPHTAKYALLRRVYNALPFLNKTAAAVYRKVDRDRNLKPGDPVTARDVFLWQYENLTAMLGEVGGKYE